MTDPHAERHLDASTKHAVKRFLARVEPHCALAAAWLFGSRARGGFRPDSDADVALLIRGRSGPFLATKLELADIAYEILLETGIRIQPFPIWEDEWSHPESYVNPQLLLNIRREGIPV